MTKETLPRVRAYLARRRIVLLASVAAIGAAVLLTGPGYRPVVLGGTAARAVESVKPRAGFADLIERVKPAVISVRVQITEDDDQTTGSGSEGPMSQLPPQLRDNEQLQRFFRQFGQPNRPSPQGRQRATGIGSGFIISADGYAVTNYHVVNHASTVEVKAEDGKSYTAKVVGSDEKTDLALIKLDSEQSFPYVTFADKAPRVGDWVVAVGNPFGLTGSATAGIVSARGRDIGTGPYDDFIQIDAPINKGNSGGPTFDTDGNVVAVNTAIFSPSGGSIGIGFGIPAETVKAVVAKLKDKGYVDRGWIGVKVQGLNETLADSLGMKTTQGALVSETEGEGPAAKAGVKSGDVIATVNGEAVKDSRDLAKKIGALTPGAKVTLGLLRQGEQKTVSLTLQQMPNQKQAKADTPKEQPAANNEVPHLGLSLAPASAVPGAGGQGMVVTAVDPDGKAAEQGLRTGDVILDVGGKNVGSVADMHKVLADAQSGGRSSILMRVKSGGGTRFVALPLRQG